MNIYLKCISFYVLLFVLQKYYEILNISENSDQEQIRSAYLKLVKKYHPDSGSEEANVDKFQQVKLDIILFTKLCIISSF